MRRILAAIVVCAGTACAQAATVTVDFESAPDGWTPLVQTQGFDFTSTSTTGSVTEMIVFESNDPGGFGTQSLAYCPDFCGLTMTRTDATTFGISSVMIATMGGGLAPYTITGHQAGGGTLVLNTSISNSATTINFGTEWINLESVEFGIGPSGSLGNAIDNIVTTVVPVPAALWLFASALGLLSFRRARN